MPALDTGKRCSNWFEQAGCHTLQNRSCKNANAKTLGVPKQKSCSVTAVAPAPRGSAVCQPLSAERLDALAALTVGLLFSPTAAGCHQHHVAHSLTFRVKKYKETDNRANILWPFIFNFVSFWAKHTPPPQILPLKVVSGGFRKSLASSNKPVFCSGNYTHTQLRL